MIENNVAEHAEYKAILGGPSVRGCTLYVTKYPCNVCAKVIVQAGITEVVYMHDEKKDIFKSKIFAGSKIILESCLGEDNIKLVSFFTKPLTQFYSKYNEKPDKMKKDARNYFMTDTQLGIGRL